MLALLVSLVLTIDDLPMPSGPLLPLEERTEKMISALEKHEIEAVFFVISDQIELEEGEKALNRLAEKGHRLANHSASHPHISALTIDDAWCDVNKCHTAISHYTTFRPYFRYPYLDYGARLSLGGDLEKALTFANLLEKADYRHGYITINTFDWAIQDLVNKAIKNKTSIDYHALGSLYVDLIKEWATFYRKALPETTPHVLLLHANDLCALYLDRLLEELSEDGWEWALPEEAFEQGVLASFSYLRKRLIQASDVPDPPTLNLKEIKNLFYDKCLSDVEES